MYLKHWCFSISFFFSTVLLNLWKPIIRTSVAGSVLLGGYDSSAKAFLDPLKVQSRNSSRVLPYAFRILADVRPNWRKYSQLSRRPSHHHVALSAAASDVSRIFSRIAGTGSATPSRSISNQEMESIIDTSDEWIRTRTGIARRHILSGTQKISEFAIQAAKHALKDARLDPKDVDLLILATSSPDDLFGDAPYVANAIEASNAVAWDLTAACSGFLFGLVTGNQYVCSGAYKNVLIIGADGLSRWVDWTDRNTCILFGDGAGAVVLQSSEKPDPSGVLSWIMRSDGSKREKLTLSYKTRAVEGPVSKYGVNNGAYQNIGMSGKEVFLFATREVPVVIEEALKKAGIEKEEVDWLVMHQANKRILSFIADRLKIPHNKILSNLEEYGNTSAASIPLCLDESVKSGRIRKGDVVVMAGFGAGLSWGAAVLKWDKD